MLRTAEPDRPERTALLVMPATDDAYRALPPPFLAAGRFAARAVAGFGVRAIAFAAGLRALLVVGAFLRAAMRGQRGRPL
jgi:hypothetical protein